MKILFIAPLPPPITGQALASKVLLEALQKHHSVKTINYHRGDLSVGLNSYRRIMEVIGILGQIRKGNKGTDVIYIAITQSMAGNVKDLLTYLLCRQMLSRTVIHLHGGALKSSLFDRYSMFRILNNYFYRRMGAAVVLGESLAFNFAGMVPRKRLHVVSNFAEDYLFSSREAIEGKFCHMDLVRILFLSNLIEGKGHEELVDAYLGMDKETRRTIRIDFAGGFESHLRRERFLSRIRGEGNLQYHGVVSGEEKRRLLAEAHLFCLPTYYRYEGQPIAILEAYASGCAVITTGHAGIRDIFHNCENGYLVEKESVSSLREILARAAGNPEHLLQFGLRNFLVASEKYRQENYCKSLIRLIENVANSNAVGRGA